MGKTAVLFPGQGSQYSGMGKSICEQFDIARQTIEEASDILGMDMQKLCWEEDIETLTQTKNTQPAILTISVAYYRVFSAEYAWPIHYMAGHSLGEFTALACSGALSFSDALLLVRKRGEWMEASTDQNLGNMYAVQDLEKNRIEEIVSKIKGVYVSCYNTANEMVLSGVGPEMTELVKQLEDEGAKVTELTVSAPFHSPYMSYAREQLEKELKNYSFGSLDIPVISNVTAKPYDQTSQIPDLLASQMTEAVKWEQTIQYLTDHDVMTCIEMGPKAVLKRMTSRTPHIQSFSFDRMEDRKRLTSLSKTHPPSKRALIHQCLAHAVSTKNRNFVHEDYQKGVIEPYEEVHSALNLIEEEQRDPSTSEILAALDMLLTVCRTKKVPVEEQKDRIERILSETRMAQHFQDFLRNNFEQSKDRSDATVHVK